MPEGPEVTKIAEELNTYLKNKKLLNIHILPGSKYVNKNPNKLNNFVKLLPIKLISVKNKGKLIYWTFEKNNYMLNHLIMTGIWSKKKEKYASIEFDFGEKIYFCDARKFGFVEFLDSKEELDNKLSKLGPDFLNDKKLNLKLFTTILRNKNKSNITSVLMNQENLSGIGNYLKSEILYAAKISPHRTVSSLTDKDIENIYKEGKRIINESYNYGGVSSKDYLHLDGSKGNFQNFLKVYGKTKDSYNNNIIKEKTKDNRTTYWVKNLQF